jgi:hypothetical protein
MRVLSWRQSAALPEFGVFAIPAKLDTGALGTALHAAAITVQGDRVAFRLLAAGHLLEADLRCEADLADVRRVTSSNGAGEERPFIRTRLVIGSLPPQAVEVSLTSRPTMRFPLLVGRAALQACEALVDPRESQLDHAKAGSCHKVSS